MLNRASFSLVACATALLAGCSSGAGRQTAQVVPVPPAAARAAQGAAPALQDPVVQLLIAADRHFDEGQQELALGHLDRAKVAFDRALDSLLESPQGAREDARVREHFDRLVDRISALELNALATGDGFTETRTEPASIDALLAIGTFDLNPPNSTTIESVGEDLERNEYDIPVPPDNERVLRYVELFQGRLRDFLTEGLIRGTPYLPMIQSVFQEHGLPLDLAYVPLIESAFKPTALSKASARGVWQFMRGTGIENGLKSDWYIDERADTEKATVAAAKYFKTLHKMFGDWHLAMASYNGGPGRMQRAIKRSNLDDFWELTATTRFLPRETRDYVPMILAAIIIAKNPAEYGFDILAGATAAPVPETVTVPAALDLRRVAEWAGVPIDDVQKLNPQFRRWTTPIRPGEYAVKVPEGTAQRVQEGLMASSATQHNALQWHTVKKGESLATIARKLKVSRTDLAEANYLQTSAKVKISQRLVVPRMPTAALLARAGTGAPPTEADIAESTAVDEATRVVYRVRSGDTLSGIARRHGTTIDQLRAWNKMRGSKLNVGDRIIIQSSRTANTQQ